MFGVGFLDVSGDEGLERGAAHGDFIFRRPHEGSLVATGSMRGWPSGWSPSAMWSLKLFCAPICGCVIWRARASSLERGLVIINPPHTLEADLLVLMPWLCEVLKQGEGAGWRLDGIVTEEMAARWAG